MLSSKHKEQNAHTLWLSANGFSRGGGGGGSKNFGGRHSEERLPETGNMEAAEGFPEQALSTTELTNHPHRPVQQNHKTGTEPRGRCLEHPGS